MSTDPKAPHFLKLPIKDELARIAVYYDKTPDTVYEHGTEVTRLFAEREKPIAPEVEFDR